MVRDSMSATFKLLLAVDLRNQMCLHYKFSHTCGHTGIGPLISSKGGFQQPHSLEIPSPEKLTIIHLRLPFPCPFCPASNCSSWTRISEVSLDQGILTIISPTYPWSWIVMRSCKYEDVTPQDWAHSTSENSGYRQMAWIPRPCGEVRVAESLEEVVRDGQAVARMTTGVASAWRQRADEPVESRFAGLLSQFNAAILSGDRSRR
jgi:hypothetical protein